MTHPRVVLLYNHAPSGHSQAALSIETALKVLRPGAECFHVTLSECVNPVIGPLVANVYLQVAETLPALWDYLYDNAAVADATQALLKIFRRGEGERLDALIQRHKADIVVATQALPLNVLAYEKRRGRLSVPLAGVLTDFIAHRYWPVRGVDWYAVPAEDTRREMQARGFAARRVHVTGIPLRAAFSKPKTREQARVALGLDPHRPVVLVAGGTRGLGRLEDAVRALLHCHYKPTVLVTSGTNTELAARLKKLAAPPHLVLHQGLEDKHGHLPMAADVLVGKPGGVTTSEALSLGLPMIVFGAYPGQERANSRFLKRHGAALEAATPAQVAAATNKVLEHARTRETLSEHALALGRPHAASAIAELILRSVEGKELAAEG